MGFRKLLLGSLAATGMVSVAGQAVAQDQESSTVGDVVVTAERRDQSIQDVPVAVSAFTAEMREETGIITAQQQLNFTPGVHYTEGTGRVTIRGVGRTTDQFGTDPGVAIYSDGVYVPSIVGIGASTLRQARTEVLRGPQGTLYGRNSIGGAVNTISRRPSDEFESEVRGGFNDYEGRRFEGYVSTPITENLRASFAASYFNQEGGYFQNSCEGSSTPDGCSDFEEGGVGDGWDAEVQLEWNAGAFYDGWVRVNAVENTMHPRTRTGVSPYAVGRLDSTINPTYGTDLTGDNVPDNPLSPSFLDPFSNPALGDPRIFTTDLQATTEVNDAIFIVTEHVLHFDSFDIKYTGGYQTYESPGYIDGDATSRNNFTYDAVGCINPAYGTLSTVLAPLYASETAAVPMNSTAAIIDALEGGLLSGGQFGSAVLAAGYLDSVSSGAYRNPFLGPAGALSFDCDTNQLNGVSYGQTTVANQLVFGLTSGRDAQSHEINIASTHDGPFQWIVGLYYYKAEDTTDDIGYSYLNQPEVTIVSNPLCARAAFAPACAAPGAAQVGAPLSNPDEPGVTGNSLYLYDSALETTSTAIYGQIDWDFTDTLHFTLGLRHSIDEKEGFEDNTRQTFWFPFAIANDGSDPAFPQVDVDGVPGIDPIYLSQLNLTAQAYQTFDPGGSTRTLTDEWSATTGTAGLQWTPSDDTLIYGRYSRGYKSGGFNLGTVVAAPIVDEETIDALELGWKQSLMGGAFQFNAAAFFYQYHDLQTTQAEEPAPGVIVSRLVNLPEVESLGLEVETIWNVTENFRVFANYTWLDTEIVEAPLFVDAHDPDAVRPGARPSGPPVDGAQPQTIIGNRLPASPEHKASISAVYTANFSAGSLSLAATANWRDDSFYTIFNVPDFLIEGGSTTDLTAIFRSADDRFAIVGSVTNVFDEDLANGFDTLPPTQNFFQFLYLEPPRVASVELQFRF